MQPLGLRTVWTRRLAAMLGCAWLAMGAAAIRWPSHESDVDRTNRLRLERMNAEQRRQLWERYEEFLTLPLAEQQRLRRLQADLQSLPADKRTRYREMMELYVKWKDSLPLYQQHMLDNAALKGSTALYNAFRDVQKRRDLDDRLRPYWFVPEATPGLRKALPKVLGRLTPSQLEELDQTPPLDRMEKLLSMAQKLGLETVPPAAGRGWTSGPLPPPDPEKLREFLQKLPREQLEELGDLGLMKAIRERRIRELYYMRNPDEYRARMRKPDDPNRPGDRFPRPQGAEPPPPPGQTPDRAVPREPGK